MKAHQQLAALVTGTMAAQVSFAQQGPGYDIAWGVQAVPLSPALSALIVLMMGLATWAFMRKRRGTGFMAAVAAVALGTMSYNSDLIANGFGYTIATPTGSAFVECNQSGETVGTSIPEGVTLTRVDPRLVVTSSQEISIQVSYPTCAVGTRVTPESPCVLFCVAG